MGSRGFDLFLITVAFALVVGAIAAGVAEAFGEVISAAIGLGGPSFWPESVTPSRWNGPGARI